MTSAGRPLCAAAVTAAFGRQPVTEAEARFDDMGAEPVEADWLSG